MAGVTTIVVLILIWLVAVEVRLWLVEERGR